MLKRGIFISPDEIDKYVIENFQNDGSWRAFSSPWKKNVATVILQNEEGNFLKKDNRYAHYKVYFKWVEEPCEVVEILKVKLVFSINNLEELHYLKNNAYGKYEREAIRFYLSVIENEKTTL